MNVSTTFCIALGSNMGDKFQQLQTAVLAIHQRIGTIKQLSPIYKSPAWGFVGNDFFNACLVLESTMAPEVVLSELLVIENDLGRIRNHTNRYEARSIDLDIILIEDLVVENDALQVPHPEMFRRRFVLQPLSDLCPEAKHPISGETIATMLTKCPDTSALEPLAATLKNPMDAYCFSRFNHVAIEGNIGAGKTSLATKIAQDFNAKLVLERFTDNPFLPKFYQDAKRYAFPLEMSFLAARYQQISDDLSQLDLFKDAIVSDYDVFKSLIFSRITLNDDEFNLYRRIFNMTHRELPKPDRYIYLQQNIASLQKNIQQRGRPYEQRIEPAYLERIHTGYLNFLKTKKPSSVKIIDLSNRDFVNNRSDYLWVLEAVCVP